MLTTLSRLWYSLRMKFRTNNVRRRRVKLVVPGQNPPTLTVISRSLTRNPECIRDRAKIRAFLVAFGKEDIALSI